MRSFIQRCLIGLYGIAGASGFLSNRIGRKCFWVGYRYYKDIFEARNNEALHRFIRHGDTVIDVGANLGFFTSKFAKWVEPDGCVVAIEPELSNVQFLTKILSEEGLIGSVDIIKAAVVESDGTVQMDMDTLNPMDHRVSNYGVSVEAVSIDSLLEARNWPNVSLIKIDTQGSEARIIQGARKTLEKLRPVLYLEIDDVRLQLAGSSSKDLLQMLAEAKYRGHLLSNLDRSLPMSEEEILQHVSVRGYWDYLFLPIEMVSSLSQAQEKADSLEMKMML